MSETNSPPSLRNEHVMKSNMLGTGGEQSRDDGPEAIVRDDTRWINFIRVFLVGTLLAVAFGLSAATYKVLSKLENETFHNEFDAIATRITQLFLHDLRLKMWIANLATQALSKQTSESNALLDADHQFLEKLSLGAGVITVWERIGFSPLIWSQSERNEWEASASKKKITGAADENTCYVCGYGFEVGSPDNHLSIGGEDNVPCGLIELAGLSGSIPTPGCRLLPPLLQAACNCQPQLDEVDNKNETVAERIFSIVDGKRIIMDDTLMPPLSPVWEAVPSPPTNAVLFNQMSDRAHRQALEAMAETKLPTFSLTSPPGNGYYSLLRDELSMTTLFYPVFDKNATSNNGVVGSIAIDFSWLTVLGFGSRISSKSNGITFVIENNLGDAFTFEISDNRIVSFTGEGDLHDAQFDSMMKQSTYDNLMVAILTQTSEAIEVPESALLYKIRVYPSQSFKAQYVTRRPVYYTIFVASIFVFTSAIFILYDVLVRRRQVKVMHSAVQSNAIFASLFPAFMKSRVLRNAHSIQGPQTGGKSNVPRKKFKPLHSAAPKQQLKTILNGSVFCDNVAHSDSEPIADFFPNVTVVFADIAGFTAWSSEREPAQVFQLLESVYQTFDTIAVKHGVFKIETIGDCYVAVTGLPDAQPDHAVRMARFSYEIMLRMHELAASLEALLGPGTGGLSIRVGMHSGSVTGGVLRGERARFQLFGDTMNTASRMQTTGDVNMIQATETTAALLSDAGYAHWVEEREEKVFVKGKGDMQTFSIDLGHARDDAHLASMQEGFLRQIESTENLPDLEAANQGTAEDSVNALVNWNTALLERFLKKVVAARRVSSRGDRKCKFVHHPGISATTACTRPIEDVTEMITMPKFCGGAVEIEQEQVELATAVRPQLRRFVERIAEMYPNNPFHNFEHASHVAMSASKIINRIVKPEGIEYNNHGDVKNNKQQDAIVARQIHNSTFGISSDALLQFAIIFSALIHDVDHSGVPNAQLVKEKHELAVTYNNKCVAEQHSVQIAWDLLMEDQFEHLRACIFTSNEEQSRFRQLVVNAVLATDIFDVDMRILRKNRWDKAFPATGKEGDNGNDKICLKATAVVEYIIQASDVAHTMQHWHVYTKWNERLFEEQYLAYLAGRQDEDPSIGWYNGEIIFFDQYVIPLARKLETCGVFGVSSDEYLNYALENRHEWERRGHDIVQRMKLRFG